MKDVIIEIKGTQSADGDSDTIELTTVGKMDVVGSKTYLRYEDGSATGQDAVLCLIKFDKDENSVVMQRSGALNSRMYIKKGQRHVCHYETGQGIITMGIFGENVLADLCSEGGNISVSYTIDINCGFVSRNNVEINVKEA